VITFASSLITTFQAIVLGGLQGISELFPISSLGHTVLFPTLFGWHNIVAWQTQTESPWLAFIVMLHVGSAIGLLIYFWRDWVEIVGAFFATLRKRKIETRTERLAWLIVVTCIPTGILGLVLEHPARVATATPEVAAIFLVVNGIMLLGAEVLRRRQDARMLAVRTGDRSVTVRNIDSVKPREGVVFGFAQSLGLIAGMSRDGAVMATGLSRGLDNAGAARLSFLFATPIILAAGLYKIPSDLLGPNGNGVRGEAFLAGGVAAVVAVFTVHFLTRYFKTRNLVPFGIYCILFGLAMVIYNA
jgi:undecaprenyl-diphosphatase